ncbi:hypothetical protein N9L68_07045 [bacterium]|nr:hypothetical protein [bacterium]
MMENLPSWHCGRLWRGVGEKLPQIPPPREGCIRLTGLVEAIGRHVRDRAWVLKRRHQTCAGREVLGDEAVMPWLLRWGRCPCLDSRRGETDARRTSNRQAGCVS